LRARFPTASITVLTSPRSLPVIAGLSDAHGRVVPLTPLAFDPQGSSLTRWREIRGLRRRRFDYLFDLSGIETRAAGWKRRLFVRLIHARQSFGRNTDGRGSFFGAAHPGSLIGEQHEVERKLGVVALVGAVPSSTELHVVLPSSAETHAGDFLLQHGVGAEDFLVGMNPGALRRTREWSPERYARIVRFLAGRYNARVLITGGRPDQELVAEVRRLSGVDTPMVCADLGLFDSMALIARCQLFLSNNTGPMHMAAALDVPLVVLFDQNNELRYRPWMDRSRYVLLKTPVGTCPYKSVPTGREECYDHDCPTNECMQAITVESVEQAIEELIDRLGLPKASA